MKFCKGNGLESTDEDSVRKRLPSSKYVGFKSTSAPPSAASGRPPVQASTSRLHTETMERPKKKLCNNGAKSQTLPAIPPFPFPPSTPETVPDLRQDERELRLFQMLEEIKGQVRQNSLLLQAILRRESVTEVSSFPDFEFPLQKINDIKKMEDRLSDKETRRSLVKQLMSLGGTTTKDIIYRIMRETISNDLAKKFNWMGRGQKSPFSVLHLAKVIIDAAKKQGATLMEAEEKIKTWLKYSGDRNGGRKRRSEKERQTHSPSHPPSDISSESEEVSEITDIEQN
ncbi:uncharacterized protein LOC121715575 [Alosa sapidissima]|uniref:uncharacterized protein LOC121715575 n=1 Tax=Alosa sapidissima TaxID=34773 RepID=UPI001C0881FC|nr:uncharacterized protein LOC121715575 [Alosa sapidissima]